MRRYAFLVLFAISIPGTPLRTTASALASYPTLRLSLSGHPWQLRLTHAFVTHSVGASYTTPLFAKGKYIILSFEALNLSKQPNDLYSGEDFLILDSSGRTFSVDSRATSYAQTQYGAGDSFQVQPSFTNHISFVFDIAKDANHLRLLNHPYGHTARLLYVLNLGMVQK